jgi:hypothetical protein
MGNVHFVGEHRKRASWKRSGVNRTPYRLDGDLAPRLALR